MTSTARKALGFVVVSALAMALSPSAQALQFKITDRNATAFQAQANALADALEDIVNNSLFPAGVDEQFLRAMGNASAGATRGMGTDPVSQWDNVSVTAQLGAAIETPDPNKKRSGAQKNQLPDIGLDGQAGVSVGLPAKSLGIESSMLGLDANRLKLYANFMKINIPHIGNGMRLGFSTMGIQGQYQWKKPDAGSWLYKWTGIEVSSGLQYSSLDVGYATPLSFSTSGSGISMSYDANLDLGVSTSILTVPFEAATGVTLCSFLTLYGGLGVDLNLGGSKLEGGVSGPVVGKDGGGTTVFTGTGTVDANSPEAVRPNPLDARLFMGTQFNIWALRLFAQATFSSPHVTALLAGLRVSF
jgi:hypothetical protein